MDARPDRTQQRIKCMIELNGLEICMWSFCKDIDGCKASSYLAQYLGILMSCVAAL
jgi:hypothetical protein